MKKELLDLLEAYIFTLLKFILESNLKSHSGQENLKKSRPKKKLMKLKKTISRKFFFDQIPLLAVSEMAIINF